VEGRGKKGASVRGKNMREKGTWIWKPSGIARKSKNGVLSKIGIVARREQGKKKVKAA